VEDDNDYHLFLHLPWRIDAAVFWRNVANLIPADYFLSAVKGVGLSHGACTTPLVQKKGRILLKKQRAVHSLGCISWLSRSE